MIRLKKQRSLKALRISPFLAWGLILLWTLALALLLPATACLAAIYFVDAAGGLDTAPGLSSASPWKTIVKVNNSVFSPGDQILFKRGGVWREQLTVPSSGASGNPIVFGAYGTGNAPKITGSDVVGGWLLEGGNLYYKGGYTANPKNVGRNGTLLVNVGTKAGVTDSSKWWWDGTNGRVYIYGDPSADTVEVGKRARAVNTNGKSYVTLDSLNLEGGIDATIYCSYGSSDITISNDHIKNSVISIDVSSGVGNNGLITGNHIEYAYINCITVYASAAKGWRIVNNEINNWGVVSAQILGGLSPQGIYMQMADGLIEHNHIHDGGFQNGSDHCIYVENCPALIRFNHLHHAWSTGVKANPSNNVQIYYNLIHDNDCGILSRNSMGMKIYNNVIYHNTNKNLSGHEGFGIQVDGGTVAEIKNNIIAENAYWGNGANQIFTRNGGAIAAADYNCVYFSGGGNLFSYQGVSYSWSAWQAQGFEAHGVNANPQLVNPAAGDYHLQATSPCAGAGSSLGLTLDYQGNSVGSPPCIGAYELPGIPPPTNLRVMP